MGDPRDGRLSLRVELPHARSAAASATVAACARACANILSPSLSLWNHHPNPGKSLLPPWPVRAACKPLDKVFSSDSELFKALRLGVSVYHNASGDAGTCYNLYGDTAASSDHTGSDHTGSDHTGSDHTGSKPARSTPTTLHAVASSRAATRRTMRSPISLPRPAWLGAVAGAGTGADRDGAALALSECRGNWGYQWCKP